MSVHNIMAFGDYAFMSYYEDGVRVLDISDPTNPDLVAYYNTFEPSKGLGSGAFGIDVDIDNGLIYVADTPRGLMVLQMDDALREAIKASLPE